MSTKAERGTKRTCQNPECGSRFYDLNRDPITCPICQSVYELSAAPAAIAAAAPKAEACKPVKKPVFQEPVGKADETADAVVDEALAVLETEEEPAAGEEDETFLEEEEEEGPDMSNIIGGPVAEGEEPQ